MPTLLVILGAMITLDFREDAAELQAMLKDAVRKYVGKSKAKGTAKKHPPVSRIDLSFSLGDSEATPWVHLHFDTKPGSDPDGSPTHPDFAKLRRKSWLAAVQATCEDESVKVIGLAGKARKCAGDALVEAVGSFLVAMLLDARATGVFEELPKTKRCELGVEDPCSGAFGWPAYEQRGKENLV